MSQASKIRKLAAAGKSNAEIAQILRCSAQYVCTQVWRAKHPSYHRNWMREKRVSDPAYYDAELDQTREYNAKKRGRTRRYVTRRDLAKAQAAQARGSSGRRPAPTRQPEQD